MKCRILFTGENVKNISICRLPKILPRVLGVSYGSGPSFSKLTTSLVNDSLKFTLSDTQIC